MTIDTSTDAVERRAANCATNPMGPLWDLLDAWAFAKEGPAAFKAAKAIDAALDEIAATLRSLAAERDALLGFKANVHVLQSGTLAERDAARAEAARLREALQHLYACDHWAQTAVGCDSDIMNAARERARTALAPKDTGND
jgi:hypothetical protein